MEGDNRWGKLPAAAQDNVDTEKTAVTESDTPHKNHTDTHRLVGKWVELHVDTEDENLS